MTADLQKLYPGTDLVGVREISERLGFRSRATVTNWRERYPSFPPPVADLSMGPVYSWKEFVQWYDMFVSFGPVNRGKPKNSNKESSNENGVR